MLISPDNDMDLLHGLREKVRFTTRMYEQAVASFVETKRKIECSEGDFDYSGWDPESFAGEPPFLSEWQEADEATNLLGQASLSLVQSTLREYLDGCLFVSRCAVKPQKKAKESWFTAYQRFFNDQFGIDWTVSPVHPALIEEINLARNDAQHTGEEFGMNRYMDAIHRERFPRGLFGDPFYVAFAKPSSSTMPALLRVTDSSFREAAQRVLDFCAFIDEQRPK